MSSDVGVYEADTGNCQSELAGVASKDCSKVHVKYVYLDQYATALLRRMFVKHDPLHHHESTFGDGDCGMK